VVCVGHDHERCKADEPIEMSLWADTWAHGTMCGTHWRHLVNTVERSARSGDAQTHSFHLSFPGALSQECLCNVVTFPLRSARPKTADKVTVISSHGNHDPAGH